MKIYQGIETVRIFNKLPDINFSNSRFQTGNGFFICQCLRYVKYDRQIVFKA